MSIRYHQEAQSSYQDTVYQGYTDIRLGVRKEHTHTTLSADELALQRKRYAHLSDEEFRFMLQQVVKMGLKMNIYMVQQNLLQSCQKNLFSLTKVQV